MDDLKSVIKQHFRCNFYPAVESDDLVDACEMAINWVEVGAGWDHTVVTKENEYFFETSEPIGYNLQTIEIWDLLTTLNLTELISDKTQQRIIDQYS
jgi:hypothetical protein